MCQTKKRAEQLENSAARCDCDWDKVQLFATSGWAIPGQVPPGATATATKWHLRGSPPVYLNAQLDPMRKQTTIDHEAAVRAGETFYMLFVRTEAGKVGSLVAAGAVAVVRADRRQPAGPAKRGPDILLGATGTRNMARYLRAGWKNEEEIGDRSGAQSAGRGMESGVPERSSGTQDGHAWSM